MISSAEIQLCERGKEAANVIARSVLRALNGGVVTERAEAKQTAALMATLLHVLEDDLRSGGTSEALVKVFERACVDRCCEIFQAYRSGLGVAVTASKVN